jgi:tetratricopeptide (TPR) repeat protein
MNVSGVSSSLPIDPVNGSSVGVEEPNRSPLGSDISELVFKKALVLLFIAGLIVRVAFLLEHARTPSFAVPTLDQVYYDTVAKMLLAGEDLHQLHGFRPLLYPMFLAFCYKVGSSWGPDLAIVLQHVCGVATAVLVAVLGARLFKHRLSGLIGGALFLLAPVPLYFEGELLIEPTYIFLIFIALWLHLLAAEKTGWKSAALWCLCGALIVLAAQARANIMVFLAIYPIFALWRALSRGERENGPQSVGEAERDGITGGRPLLSPLPGGEGNSIFPRATQATLPLCGMIGALLMAIPWGIVNMSQSDHFHLLPNAGGVALYLGNKRTADGMTPEQERRIYSGDRYQDSIETWAREEYETAMRAQGRPPDTDPMAISHYWTRRTLDEIKAAPATWLKLMAKKTWLTFWNAEVPNNKAFAFLQRDYLWLRILPIRWVVLLVFVPAGIWLSFRRGNQDALVILLAYAALYSAANIVFFICDRYRYPVWPAAAIFAGGGLLATLKAFRLTSPVAQLKRLILRRSPAGQGMPLLLHPSSTGQSSFKSVLAFSAVALLMVVVSLPNWFRAELPNFSRDYFFRSIAWYQKGHFQEALNDINKSVELYPSEASALHHRGNVLFALNRLTEAEGAYEQALTLSHEEAGLWNNLGATLASLGRTTEALTAFERAMACKPPSKNAFLGAAFLQVRLGRFDEAADTLVQLERVAPGPDAAALAVRSILARKRGDIAGADTLERRARRLDPDTALWAMQRAEQP